MTPNPPRTWLIAIVLWIMIQLPANALGEMPAAEVKEFGELKIKAEQGDEKAQISIGIRYANGIGVTKDLEEAVKWFLKAAEKGNAMSQYNLGNCYRLGRGVKKDETEAVKWYRKAAEKGVKAAQHNLGVCCESGLGMRKDAQEAVKWYRKAAEQGLGEAQNNLADCYAHGIGVAKDEIEAYGYFSLAINTYEESRNNLAKLERGMSAGDQLLGKQRTKELKKAIEAMIATRQEEHVRR